MVKPDGNYEIEIDELEKILEQNKRDETVRMNWTDKERFILVKYWDSMTLKQRKEVLLKKYLIGRKYHACEIMRSRLRRGEV